MTSLVMALQHLSKCHLSTELGDIYHLPHSDIIVYISVFCPGFQKGRVPSEKGTFSAVNGPSKGHN